MRYVIRFSVLASGSSGNACYVETENTRILIDAGLSSREIERRLDRVGVAPSSLDALIITHEHTDHIRGAGPFARRFDLPLYTNRKTLERGINTLGNLSRTVIIQTGQPLTIKDLNIETFTKCHDAADPVGIVLSCCDGSPDLNRIKIGLATDLGRSTRLVEDRLKGCQALIMEFNHDQEMLDEGPYPIDLKRRIKGPDGHLSNQQAGDLLRAVSHQNLKFVVLAHLSETNNHPKKAYQEAANALIKCGFNGANILISRQDEPGQMIEL
jgi:phosphoribosyl 1,2-cyclic phosphodiesterase